MNTKENAIKYAPGFPGYGTKGLDGSVGTNGISLYFSKLNGVTDFSNISNAIFNNYLLDSSDIKIPGYPTRVYQTGDYFIDNTSEIYVIDLKASPYYKKTGLKLNSYGLFEDTQIQNNIGFKRYSNIVSNINRNIIDTVYANSNANYAASPTNIYGIKPENYGKIFYCNILSNNYNPFTVFTSGNFNDNALAIVKNAQGNSTDFHIGNLDASGKVRKTKLIFDVNQLLVARDESHRITESSPLGTVLTTNEINAPYIFNGEKITKNYFDVSTTATTAILKWDKSKYLKTTDNAILNKIKCDLIFYSPSDIDGSSFNYNNPYNNSIIFEDIENSGTITVTNLKDGAPYKTYLKFSDNGWSKTSDILECTTNLIPVIKLTLNGKEVKNGDTISMPPNIAGEFIFNITTNVGNWIVSSGPKTGDDIKFGVTSPINGNGNGQIKFSITNRNETERVNTNKILISSLQYGINFIVYMAQEAFIPQLNITPDAFTFSRDASNSSLGVNTNLGEWTYVVSDSWISAFAPNGTSGSNQLNISVQSNQGTSRQGNIKISSTKRPDIFKNVTIQQQVGYETGTVAMNVTMSGSEIHTSNSAFITFSNTKTFEIPREIELQYTIKGRLYPSWWLDVGGFTSWGYDAFTQNKDKILLGSEFNSCSKVPDNLNYIAIQGDNTNVEIPQYPGDNPIIISIVANKKFITNGWTKDDYFTQHILKRDNNYVRLQDVSAKIELISSKIAGTDVYDLIGENKSYTYSLSEPNIFVNLYDSNGVNLIKSIDIVGDNIYHSYKILASGYCELSVSKSLSEYVKFKSDIYAGASAEKGTIELQFAVVKELQSGNLIIKRGSKTFEYAITIRPEQSVTGIMLCTQQGDEITEIILSEFERMWFGMVKSPYGKWIMRVEWGGNTPWFQFTRMGLNGGQVRITATNSYSEQLYAKIILTDLAEEHEVRYGISYIR